MEHPFPGAPSEQVHSRRSRRLCGIPGARRGRHLHARPPGERNLQILTAWVTPPAHKTGEDGLEYDFEISDGVASVAIVYDGAPPDIFSDHAEVIATGTMNADGTFHATELLTKCPSRFEAAEETV